MKRALVMLLLFWPASLLADTIFYAPDHYTCAPQGEKCVCTQQGNSYFLASFTLRNDCDGKAPFLMKFRSTQISGSSQKSVLTPHEIPNTPQATYVISCGESDCMLQISAITKAVIGNSPNWTWNPWGYVCDNGMSHNTNDCPMIAK